MKKIISYLIISLFLLTGFSYAQEASYFDSRYGWLIRAYVESGKAMIEVRDTNNQLVQNVLITGPGSGGNPWQIAQDVQGSISLAFDESTGKAYVFFTKNGLQLATLTISSSAGNLSANPSLVNFGNVTVNQNADRTVTITNVGQSPVTLGTINVTGSGFSRAGGTCQNGQVLNGGVQCTITVRFAPSATGSYSGSLSIPSNANTLTIPLIGTAVPQISNIDLTITSLQAPKSADNGAKFNISVTITNNGSAAAGAFKVKAYFSTDTIPGNSGDQLLTTWNISSLSAGGNQTLNNTVSFSGFPVHYYHYIVVKVDADDEITESDENNNIRTQQVFVSR